MLINPLLVRRHWTTMTYPLNLELNYTAIISFRTELFSILFISCIVRLDLKINLELDHKTNSIW
jgi:hypothetical protein